MKQWITKDEISALVNGREFVSEDDFRDYLEPKLVTLLGIKSNQLVAEPVTTSFDKTLSNRADIVVHSDDNIQKALVVFELKLTKSIDKYKNGDYEDAIKQLHKYCQDLRSPYGVLLTDLSCFIYKYKYFFYGQKPKRDSTDKLPFIDKIEGGVALSAIVDFFLYKKSSKYVNRFIFGVFILMFASIMVTNIYGLAVSLIVSSIVGIVFAVVLYLALKHKVLD